MKCSDYIVERLIQQNILHVFGYPGGMVTHLMDSLGKYSQKIHTHITYHEQAAAFAACGYAESSHGIGVCFATSGPGATNLMTGIGQAYFDSLPVVFITGQVNTFESCKGTGIRQKGFQETDIIAMVQGITKAAFYVSDVSMMGDILTKAFQVALEGRMGPVVIDIPMNIFRSEIEADASHVEALEESSVPQSEIDVRAALYEALKIRLSGAERPCLLVGNGIKRAGAIDLIRRIVEACPMPVVSSMLAVDVFPEMEQLAKVYYGYIGAYGNRSANFAVAKSDLVLSIGSRMDIRQVGGKRENFAPDAVILRIDIDAAELRNSIRSTDQTYQISVTAALEVLQQVLTEDKVALQEKYRKWLTVCETIKNKVKEIDERDTNRFVNCISKLVPDGEDVVADVGQNMVWVAQSFKFKPMQRVHFSGSMGSMGYALPAAIGVYYATGKPVICFAGDGGFQMNIQELQYVVRYQLPIKMFVMNNHSLGMIRHFQEMYFEGRYHYTVDAGGYSAPDFVRVAQAYGIRAKKIRSLEELTQVIELEDQEPILYEIIMEEDTVVFPKLEYGKPNQDQEPLLDRELYTYLMEL